MRKIGDYSSPNPAILLRSIGAGSSGLRGPANHAGVHGHAFPRDRLVIQLVPNDLHQHKSIVRIETLGRDFAGADISGAQLSGSADYEVRDAFLRFNALVE